MSPWVPLAAAVGCEVAATLSLRVASVTGRRRWYVPVLVGYVAAFALLAVALAGGLPLGIAYGVWAACGVALAALASRLLFGEPLTRLMAAGIALIAAGVLLVELGAP